MNIYVGNLSRQTTEAELRQAFEKYGEVTKVNIIIDRMTNEPKGFGFVEFASKEHGQAALNGLNGTELGGRTLTVNEARPKTDGGGGRRSGGGGGYNRSW
ncbi:MAG: RNA-binding protein [Candidatus Zixiibacteriota bacterium]